MLYACMKSSEERRVRAPDHDVKVSSTPLVTDVSKLSSEALREFQQTFPKSLISIQKADNDFYHLEGDCEKDHTYDFTSNGMAWFLEVGDYLDVSQYFIKRIEKIPLGFRFECSNATGDIRNINLNWFNKDQRIVFQEERGSKYYYVAKEAIGHLRKVIAPPRTDDEPC